MKAIKTEFENLTHTNEHFNPTNQLLLKKFPVSYTDLNNIGKSFLEIANKHFNAHTVGEHGTNKVTQLFVKSCELLPPKARDVAHKEYHFSSIVFCTYKRPIRLARAENTEHVVITRNLSLKKCEEMLGNAQSFRDVTQSKPVKASLENPKKQTKTKATKKQDEVIAEKIAISIEKSQKIQPPDDTKKYKITCELIARRLAGQNLEAMTKDLGKKNEIEKLSILFPSPRDFIEFCDAHGLFKNSN